MLIRNVSREDLEQAKDAVNAMYDDNVIWNEFRHEGASRGGGNTYRVTLKVKDSRGPGVRLGFSGRHMINACYHVHGNFFVPLAKSYYFAALLEINPNAVIKASGLTIDRHGGNWEDRNIGSISQPLYFSEACECNERGIA